MISLPEQGQLVALAAKVIWILKVYCYGGIYLPYVAITAPCENDSFFLLENSSSLVQQCDCNGATSTLLLTPITPPLYPMLWTECLCPLKIYMWKSYSQCDGV